jgi:hypothetical protein
VIFLRSPFHSNPDRKSTGNMKFFLAQVAQRVSCALLRSDSEKV